MAEFFLEYGLFAAKALTLVIALFLGLAVIISLVASKNKSQNTLEVEKINDKLEEYKNTLEEEILPKEAFKALQKERKKTEKKEAKQAKRDRKNRGSDKSNETDEQDDKGADSDKESKSKLYVIRFEGDMHASEVENLRETITAILTFCDEKDEVLLLLESPGGLVHTYGLAASQLQRLRNRNIKLTVAVDLCAASGGYMMACVADHIIAAPFAVVGSIGVLAQVPNFNKLLTKLDVDIEHHTAGEHKSTLTMLGKNTNKAREKFREELEETHGLFKEFVTAHRPQLEIDKIATGEHWYGSKALDLNLIDEIKTSDDYLLDKSKTTDIYEVTYEVPETLRDKLSTLICDTGLKLVTKFWSKANQVRTA